MFTLIPGDQLLERAHRAQLRARASPAEPRDRFLIYADEEAEPGTHTNGAREMSRAQQKMVQDMLKKKSKFRRENGEGEDEYEIRRIRGGQQSDCMTEFNTNGMDAACYLPGGAPLIDHLRARLEYMPDWHCILPAVEKLRSHRLPNLERPASQREFTLGETSEEHVQIAIEFLKASMVLTKKIFITCLLAADTESIGVVKQDASKLYSGELQGSYTLRVAQAKESAEPLPVLLMVGHVGWQVHVRVPLTATTDACGRKILKLTPGKLQKGVARFLKALGTVTGVGITKDLEEFFALTSRLYGENFLKIMAIPTELENIALQAGYKMGRTGVEMLNWVCFGTILAKGKLSMGDKNWDTPWDLLHVPSRGYLAGDIGQPAGAAAILGYFWLLHIFPDACAVRELSALDGTRLVRFWDSGVFPMLTPERTILGGSPPDDEGKKAWDDQVLFKANCVRLRDLEPGWPAVTAGGPRFIHATRAFLISKLELLNATHEEFWPPTAPEKVHLVMFGRHQLIDEPVPTDPTSSPGWAPNPVLEGSTLMGSEFINWNTFLRLTGDGVSVKGLVLEYARISPPLGLALLERLEDHKKAAVNVFGCLEKAQKVVPVLRGILRSCDLEPPRPEGWVDIYHEAAAVETKVERITARARQLSGEALSTALKGLDQHEKLKRAIKNSAKKPPTIVDQVWPLMRYAAPAVKGFTRMTPEMISRTGRSTHPGVKRRSGSPGRALPKRARSTRTDGVSADNPMALLRTAVDESRRASGTGQSSSHRQVSRGSSSMTELRVDTVSTGARHSEGIADSPRASPYVLPHREDARHGPVNSIQPSGIFLVGNSHAVQSNMGLTGSLLNSRTKTITVSEWIPAAIEEAAGKFAPYDLRGTIVIMWLFDDMGFEQLETGDPLDRSAADGRLHCSGPTGVASWRGMAALMDEARPLLDACREAESVIFMVPLPMYMVEPCCEEYDHCRGNHTDEHQRYICRKVSVLHQAMVRWLSWLGQSNVFVVCPHLELMAVARTLRVDAMRFLLASYCFDGVHLTADAYRDLFDRIAGILHSQPWQFQAPMERMADPVTAPVRPSTTRRPVCERLGRRGAGQLPPDTEVVMDRFRDDDGPRAYSSEHERAARRGAWQPQSRDRSPSPPISPGFWASVRATAPKVDRPPGGRPE